MRFGLSLCALPALTLASSFANASDYVWIGANGRSWTNNGNWSGAAGHPDDENDTATIPSGYSGDDYPLFDDSAAVTIKSFKVLNGTNARNQTVLELAAPTSGTRVLKVKDADGLAPGEGGIKLNKSTELWHVGGGVMSIWGDVIFDSTNATAAQRPQFVLGNGMTLYVRYQETDPNTYAAFKSVGEQGGLIRGEVGQTDLEESLVLRPDLRGSFAVDVGLVSLGEITTDDNDSNTANTIRLSCLPKICIGEMPGAEPLLRAVGVEGKLGTIIIDAVTCIRRNSSESNSVQIDPFGVLKVNRHCVMPNVFRLESGGKVEVKAKILLAVGGLQPTCAAVE